MPKRPRSQLHATRARRFIVPLVFFVFSLMAFCAVCSQTPRAYASESSAAKEGEKEGETEKEVVGGRFENDPIYVHVAPLVMPIINEKGVEQLVTLLIDVQVRDFESASLLQASMPRVIDALLQHLYGKLSDGDVRNGKMVNVSKIKQEAKKAIGDIIDPKNVKDVLVQGVGQRML